MTRKGKEGTWGVNGSGKGKERIGRIGSSGKSQGGTLGWAGRSKGSKIDFSEGGGKREAKNQLSQCTWGPVVLGVRKGESGKVGGEGGEGWGAIPTAGEITPTDKKKEGVQGLKRGKKEWGLRECQRGKGWGGASQRPGSETREVWKKPERGKNTDTSQEGGASCSSTGKTWGGTRGRVKKTSGGGDQRREN